MPVENASFVMQAKMLQKCCVVLCQPNKLYAVGSVMSLSKIIFSRHFNNIPVVESKLY